MVGGCGAARGGSASGHCVTSIVLFKTSSIYKVAVLEVVYLTYV